MIVSKNGKSYDDSDGSEQPHEASAEPRERSEREEINRWEDDGPGPHSRAAAPAADAPAKPAWSVLSLRNLLEAIRELGRPEGGPQPGTAAGGAEPGRLPPEQRGPEAAAAVAARRDPCRNHWENT